MPLLRVPWAHYDKLFESTKGCPTHYFQVMMIIMVTHMQLRTCHGALSFDSALDNPRLSHSMCCHLEGYHSLCYESLIPAVEEELTTATDKFLCM